MINEAFIARGLGYREGPRESVKGHPTFSALFDAPLVFVRGFMESPECSAFVSFDVGGLSVNIAPEVAARLGEELTRAALVADPRLMVKENANEVQR